MRLCRRTIEFIQIVNDYGEVRICGWLEDSGRIGSLLENDLEDIYNNELADNIRKMHIKKDFSNCKPNCCPYVANGTVSENEIELDEIPKYPMGLFLAYENVCNYHCIMCPIPGCLNNVDMQEREKRLDIIDEKLRKVLPYVKTIGANGLGELFASKHILKLLSEWEPIAPPEEIKVYLETNGSLFNKENFAKISNLGKYPE